MSATGAEVLAGVVAVSPAMRELLSLAGKVADARSPVLIQGESGSGKDLLAHFIHYHSARRDGPIIKIHCPSIPEDLLESELFGHEKGAFTDARQAKVGKIELAAGGTLFFDQIEDLSLALQAKLLRVVEEKRFERLGGTRTLEVDVRFVVASTADLRRAAAGGGFREDLYHRLSVVPLDIPPLRARREDILPLAELFLRREREGKAARARIITPEAAETLRSLPFAGTFLASLSLPFSFSFSLPAFGFAKGGFLLCLFGLYFRQFRSPLLDLGNGLQPGIRGLDVGAQVLDERIFVDPGRVDLPFGQESQAILQLSFVLFLPPQLRLFEL